MPDFGAFLGQHRALIPHGSAAAKVVAT